MTRVAIFTDNDFDKVNGVTTTLRALLKLAPPSVRPRIYTASCVGSHEPDYFAVPSFGVGFPWYRDMRVYLPRLRQFARALRDDGTQVVHVTTPGPVGLAGRWLAGRLGLPLVGSYHTHLGEYVETLSGSARLGRGLDRYMQWFYRPCGTVLVPSRATERLLISRGFAAQNMRLWPRGVDTTNFHPDRASSALRQQWHVDSRRPAIVYVGRLSAEKGLGIFSALRHQLHRRAVPCQFVFVGDGPMRRQLETELPDAVFLGGIPHDRVATIMASGDVFVFPSATDSFGNVILESQACGLPTIVTDHGGPCEHVRHGETGFVYRAGHLQALTEHVVSLAKDASRRQTMSTAARAWALKCRWEDALEPVYRSWNAALDDVATIAAARILTVGSSVGR